MPINSSHIHQDGESSYVTIGDIAFELPELDQVSMPEVIDPETIETIEGEVERIEGKVDEGLPTAPYETSEPAIDDGADPPDGGGSGSGADDELQTAIDEYEAALDRLDQATQDYEDAYSDYEQSRDDAQSLQDDAESYLDEAQNIAESLEEHADALDEIDNAIDGLLGPMSELLDPLDRLNAPPDLSGNSDFQVPESALHSQSAGDPVELFSGSFRLDDVDVVLPGRGLMVSISRTYRNQAYGIGVFGAKWSSWLDASVRRLSDGGAYLWVGDGSSLFFSAGDDDTYTSAPHVTSVLAQTATGHELTDLDGVIREFDQDGRLITISDRFANTISVIRDGEGTPSRIVSPTGREVELTTNPDGQLTSIEDWMGRRWTYVYDSWQDLIEVHEPGTARHPDGRITRYSYQHSGPLTTGHNLLTISNHDGTVMLRNHYGSGDDANRIVRQETVDGEHTYHYELIDRSLTSSSLDSAARSTTHTTNGLTTVHTFGPTGLELERVETDTSGNRRSWVKAYDAAHNLIELVRPNGASIQMRYDASAEDPFERRNAERFSLVSAGDETPIESTATYGPFGVRTSTTSPTGAVTSAEIDANGLPVEVRHPPATLPDGSTQQAISTMSWNQYGQMVGLVGADGTELAWVRDADGFIVAHHVNGETVAEYEVDSLGRVTTVNDPISGSSLVRTLDTMGRVIRLELLPLGYVTELEYSRYGDLEVRRRIHVAADGSPGELGEIEERFEHDPMGRVIAHHPPAVSGSSVMEFAYDPLGEIEAIIDLGGIRQEWVRDAWGLPVEHIRAAGTSEAALLRTSFNNVGEPIEVEGPSGARERITYDGHGRTATLVAPDGSETHFTWDAESRLAATVTYDPLGNFLTSSEFVRDALGRVVLTTESMVNEAGQLVVAGTAQVTYDVNNRPIHVSDQPSGEGITIHRDHRGFPTSIVGAQGNRISFVRDSDGNPVEVETVIVDNHGADVAVYPSKSSFDILGRLEWAENAAGHRVVVEHDSQGAPTQITTPEGRVAKALFDQRGRLLQQTIDDNLVEQVDYDQRGNITRLTDGAGQVTDYTFDAQGNMIRESWTGTGIWAEVDYDSAGRISVTRDSADIVRSVTYDPLDRVTGVTTTGPPELDGQGTRTFTYSDDARTISVVDEYGNEFAQIFDAFGRPESESNSGEVRGARYNGVGDLENLSLPTGTELRYERYNDHSIQAVHLESVGPNHPGDGSAGESLVELAIGTDAATVTQYSTGAVVTQGRDQTAQITSVEVAATVGEPGVVWEAPLNPDGDRSGVSTDAGTSYTLDRDTQGRITHISVSGGNDQTFALDPTGDRLTENGITNTFGPHHQPSQLGGATVIHDSAGRLTQLGEETFAYDVHGRLVQIGDATTGLAQYQLRYDPFDRLVEASDPSGVTTRWTWFGQSLLTITIDNKVIELVPGADLDRPLLTFADGTRWIDVSDPLATPIGRFDHQGTLTQGHHLDPFGQPLSGTQPPHRGLHGALIVPGSDLLLMRARVYSPKHGRFLQPDPAGLIAGTNRYLLANGDPASLSDPFGDFPPALLALAPIAAGALIGGAIGFGFAVYDGKSWQDVAATTAFGALGGGFMGTGYGVVSIVGGAVITGALEGAYGAWQSDGSVGEVLATGAFTGVVSGAGGLLAGPIASRLSTPWAGAVTSRLTAHWGGKTPGIGIGFITRIGLKHHQAAHLAGTGTATFVGGSVEGAVEGVTSGFAMGTAQAYGAGAPLSDALSTGAESGFWGGIGGFGLGGITSVGFKGVTGVAMSHYKVGSVRTGPRVTGSEYSNFVGWEGEWMVQNHLRTQLHSGKIPGRTTGAEPDLFNTAGLWGDVKNTAEVPYLSARARRATRRRPAVPGQLQQILDATPEGQLMTIFKRPGVTPPPLMRNHPDIQFFDIPVYSFASVPARSWAC